MTNPPLPTIDLRPKNKIPGSIFKPRKLFSCQQYHKLIIFFAIVSIISVTINKKLTLVLCYVGKIQIYKKNTACVLFANVYASSTMRCPSNRRPSSMRAISWVALACSCVITLLCSTLRRTCSTELRNFFNISFILWAD